MNAGTVEGTLAGVAAAATVVFAASRWPRSRPRTLASSPAAIGQQSTRRPLDRRFAVAVAVVAALGASLLVGPGPTIVAVAGAGGAVLTRRRRAAARIRRDIESSMPDAIELLVVCLHAGLSPAQAVAELAGLAPIAVRPGFAAVQQRLHRGHGFAEAITELTACCGRSAVALVSSMSAAVRDGLPLAPVLDRLSAEANDWRRRQGEAVARQLPVRLSFPLVACTLPSFVLLAIAPVVIGALSTVRGSAP